jgi:molybdopterin-guanine dinucleotide biosynthesis protein A
MMGDLALGGEVKVARFRGHTTGFVLAGGLSRRMGTPKAALKLGSETMLARQVRLLQRLTSRVFVIGAAGAGPDLDSLLKRGEGVAVLRDRFADCGPLAGIYTGLAASRTEYNLFLGVDLPSITTRFLTFLLTRAVMNGADVTVPLSSERRLHPLCAVYHRRMCSLTRKNLARGEYRVSRIYRHVHVELVRWPELAAAGFPPRILDNMNTVQDYEAAKRRIDPLEGAASRA